MPTIQLTVTSAGLDALVDAQNGVTDAIVVAELGLASASFTAAPTLEALPNEFKRIDAIAGTSVSENMIHMVAQDSSSDVYAVYGIGLFLSDGTLFASYAQEEPIVMKVSIASFLIAFDIAFLGAVDVAIEFGDASFIYPPATETIKGVAELATNAEADAGVDDQRIMTPKKVKRVLDALAAGLTAAQAAFQAAVTASQVAFETAVNGTLAALQARTITGGGLVTGGGDLTANRVLTVAKATDAEADAGVDDQTVMTPKKVKRVLDALAAALTAAQAAFQAAVTASQVAFEAAVNGTLAALQARTITGGGLVTGGGDLTANRVLTVAKATNADFEAGIGDGVITAELLASLPRIASQIGGATIPGTGGLIIRHGRFTCVANGSVAVTFVPAFPNECYEVVISGGTGDPGAQDNFVNLVSSSVSQTGFSASNGRGFSYSCHYIAVGR